MDFDDANVPSLLSIPLLGYPHNPAVYAATHARILSPRNPSFYNGTHFAGIGSPHTPARMAWPLALAVQGLTSSGAAKRAGVLRTLLMLQCGNGLMHESGARRGWGGGGGTGRGSRAAAAAGPSGWPSPALHTPPHPPDSPAQSAWTTLPCARGCGLDGPTLCWWRWWRAAWAWTAAPPPSGCASPRSRCAARAVRGWPWGGWALPPQDRLAPVPAAHLKAPPARLHA